MKQYKNILVNSLVNLGDVVLTTSAIALLKKAYPEAKITMLVRPAVREAVEDNPIIDEVILFEYKAKQNSIRKMWAMAQMLRHRHFDLAISFDRKLRPALLCWLAGIPVRIGPDRVFDDKPSRVTWLYTDVIPITHDLENTLQAETYQQIVRGFTGMEGNAQPVMARLTDLDYQSADELFSELPAAEKKIALCVKGTFALKTWPGEYFVELIQQLNQKYKAAFFIVGARGDREYADEVIAAMQPLGVQNFCGKTSLTTLAALLQQADLFVTVDTGAAHIAATTGVPMVTIYGCTSPNRWHPYNKNARVLTVRESCCPCKIAPESCPTWPKPQCLWSITPSMVLEKCVELLEK